MTRTTFQPVNIKDAKEGKKNFLNCKTVWEIFLSHDLAEVETGRGRGADPPSAFTYSH